MCGRSIVKKMCARKKSVSIVRNAVLFGGFNCERGDVPYIKQQLEQYFLKVFLPFLFIIVLATDQNFFQTTLNFPTSQIYVEMEAFERS